LGSKFIFSEFHLLVTDNISLTRWDRWAEEPVLWSLNSTADSIS
jgi:hypothetical protein